MKRIIFILSVLFVSSRAFSLDSIVPEKVVESWGFKTIELAESRQMIRSNTSFKVGGQTYYPRYSLRKACYESTSVAKEEYANHANTVSNGKDEFRGNFFLGGRCVFQIDPNADIFKYHDKSGVVELFGQYVRSGT